VFFASQILRDRDAGFSALILTGQAQMGLPTSQGSSGRRLRQGSYTMFDCQNGVSIDVRAIRCVCRRVIAERLISTEYYEGLLPRYEILSDPDGPGMWSWWLFYYGACAVRITGRMSAASISPIWPAASGLLTCHAHFKNETVSADAPMSTCA
jgi:hypothetical protein